MTAPDKTDRLITAALAATALLFLLLTGWLQWYWSSHSMDIDVYWEAGRRMLHGGADLYLDSEDPANNVGLFIYPPLFATLFAPLTVLPRWLGYALWGMLELALVALGLRSARQLVEVPGGRKAPGSRAASAFMASSRSSSWAAVAAAMTAGAKG